MTNSNKSNNPVTIKPSRIKTVLNDIYRIGAEHVLHGFASGTLNIGNAKEIYADSQAGKANWPDVNLSQNGDDILMNISSEGSLIFQDHIAVEKDPTANTSATSKPNHQTFPKTWDIKEHLDKHIVGQNTAKRACIRAIKLHYERCFGKPYNKTPLKKKNMIIHGPSGCGKTEIWLVLEKLLGIPIFIEDASLMTKPGHKGRTPEDLAREIWLYCDKDMEKAMTCILVFDEWDKMTDSKFQRETLNSLLKFVEGGKVPFKENALSPDTEFLDTSNILIVAMGAFEGIESMFEESGSMGLLAKKLTTQTPKRNEIAEKIDLKHFNKWGFNSQILGRFPIRTYILELTEDELIEVQLNVPGSVYHEWIELFARLDSNASLEFTKPAMKLIAQNAIKQKTGARELGAIYDKVLGDAYLEADMDENINQVKVYVEKGELKIQYGAEIQALESIFKNISIEQLEA